MNSNLNSNQRQSESWVPLLIVCGGAALAREGPFFRAVQLRADFVQQGRLECSAGGGIMPSNGATSRPYSGANIIVFWMAREENGYETANWMTYRQALALGGQVRPRDTESRFSRFESCRLLNSFKGSKTKPPAMNALSRPEKFIGRRKITLNRGLSIASTQSLGRGLELRSRRRRNRNQFL